MDACDAVAAFVAEEHRRVHLLRFVSVLILLAFLLIFLHLAFESRTTDSFAIVRCSGRKNALRQKDFVLRRVPMEGEEEDTPKTISIKKLDGTVETRSVGGSSGEQDELAAAIAMSLGAAGGGGSGGGAAPAAPSEELQADLIAQFVGMTGAEVSVARGVLERTGWNLEVAADAFFEGGAGAGGPVAARSSQEPEPEPAEPEPAEAPAPAPEPESLDPIDNIMSKAKEAPPPEAAAAEGSSFAGRGFSMKGDDDGAGEGPAGATGMRQRRGGGAGGEGKAGAARPEVPPRTVIIVFYLEGYTVEDAPEPAGGGTGGTRVVGGKVVAPARRTGVTGLRSSSGGSGSSPALPPLRRYDDPKHKAFLDQVKASQLPPELMHTTQDTGLPIPVNISLSDRRPQPYPAEQEGAAGGGRRAFAGAGQTLGGGSGGTTSGSGGGGETQQQQQRGQPEQEQQAPLLGLAWLSWLWSDLWRRIWGLWSTVTGLGAAATAAGPPPIPIVDASQPTTEIRLRLADGSKMVTMRLNETMTADDLYALAAVEIKKHSQDQTQPQPHPPQPQPLQQQEGGGVDVAERAWVLAGGYPPRPIDRDAAAAAAGEGEGENDKEEDKKKKSLKELELLGAVVTQRWL